MVVKYRLTSNHRALEMTMEGKRRDFDFRLHEDTRSDYHEPGLESRYDRSDVGIPGGEQCKWTEQQTKDYFLPACRRRVGFHEMPDCNCSHPPLDVSTFSSDLPKSSYISVDRHHVCPLPLCRISFAENCPRDCSTAR